MARTEMSVFDYAMKAEKDGIAFYTKAAKKFNDRELRDRLHEACERGGKAPGDLHRDQGKGGEERRRPVLPLGKSSAIISPRSSGRVSSREGTAW